MDGALAGDALAHVLASSRDESDARLWGDRRAGGMLGMEDPLRVLVWKA